MKKSKGQTVDLLYTNNKKKKNNRKNMSTKSKTKTSNKQTINLDNEIVIGLTPKKDEKEKIKKEHSKKRNSNKKPQKNTTKKEKTKNKKTKKTSKKKSIILKIIKWVVIAILILAAIIMFMLSSVFNIKEIKVINNNKISTEEIIKLSTLQTEKNMFKTTNRTIINSIKTNSYIEDVNIKRNINGVVTLEITERKPTYMLKFANAYVYINNQGYMLEITETPLEVPMITGFETPLEQIKEGNRLINEDLKKLEDIIKIMNSAADKSLSKIITSIDISDSSNYELTIISENKVVYFGDITNINVKLLRIEEVIQKEKGIAGEIYFQDSEKTVFREKV